MRAAGIIGSVVFVLLILGITFVEYRSRHPRVPPSLGPTDCLSEAQAIGTPRERFASQGGRTTSYVKVWREGLSLTAANVTEGRDLRQYEQLELADPEPRTVADRRGDGILAKAREFIWDHWQDRKRGYLRLTLSSVDATSTSHIFVEKDDAGRWRVYWRIVRHHSEVDDLPTAYDVRWVVASRDWNAPGTPVPPNEKPDPLRHRLEFRNTCGDLEGRFW